MTKEKLIHILRDLRYKMRDKNVDKKLVNLITALICSKGDKNCKGCETISKVVEEGGCHD